MHAGIEAYSHEHLEDDFARVGVGRHEEQGRGYGRTEVPSYLVCEAPADLLERARWAGLKAIGMAIGETTRDGRAVIVVRPYILSRPPTAEEFAAAVRSHWAIENRAIGRST